MVLSVNKRSVAAKSSRRHKRSVAGNRIPRNCGAQGNNPKPLIDRLLGKAVYNEADGEHTNVTKALSLFREISTILKPNATSGRVDHVVGTIMKNEGKWVNTGEPILGDVPGVEVGDEFHGRVELAVVGLHHPYQAGIDYVRRNDKTLATSIVASGGYADQMENSDVLEYSGHGGMPDKKKAAEDQKMERGNLALKNSSEEKNPVRVIRGDEERKGKLSKTYTYGGLYLVENYREEIGSHGTKVFKFLLRRISAQQELVLKETTTSRVCNGIRDKDISKGKEKMRIAVVNREDDEKPSPFEYVTTMKYPSSFQLNPPEGCDCINGCSDEKKCLCVVKNGEIPYNEKGAILEYKPVVYECGPSCSCPPTCQNRVSQNGIKLKLEIFKTKSRGWGVRSSNYISSGRFVCEYTGELLQENEAEQRVNKDEYLLDIGHDENDSVEEGGFTIDALHYGNIGRFINHSCTPNLYLQNVVYAHDDKRMPHIMLFASENIPPSTELTYDYNYKQVCNADGERKKKKCLCGSGECTGLLY